MFESVVAKSEPPHARLPALGLSVLVFGSLAAVLALWPSRSEPVMQRAVEVTFTVAKPAPAPATPAPAAAAAAAPARRNPARSVAKKRELVPAPAALTASEPVAANPAPTAAVVESAASGGSPSGASTAAPAAVSNTTHSALPFGPGMTRPEQIAGGTPEYTREALAARVEGKVLVRCVITKQGSIQDCKLIKGVPFLDRITLDSLAQSRWKPVTYRGQTEAVQYLFTFNFKLP